MTPMKEDYLKIIFELGGGRKKVSNKEISLGLGIAAGSVTEMITKLADEGLVEHEPYAGIALTEKGGRYAAELVRKHRLWETFLVDKLHYNMTDVHPEAEILEHKTSDHLATALDGGEVNEHVVTSFAGDKPVTLFVIKPLNSSLFHG